MLLVNNLHEKRITESQNGRDFGSARAICNCTSVTTLHSCYMKNAHVFSQSDARNVFMFMITDRYGLMLLWFTDLMNVTEEVTIHLGL